MSIRKEPSKRKATRSKVKASNKSSRQYRKTLKSIVKDDRRERKVDTGTEEKLAMERKLRKRDKADIKGKEKKAVRKDEQAGKKANTAYKRAKRRIKRRPNQMKKGGSVKKKTKG